MSVSYWPKWVLMVLPVSQQKAKKMENLPPPLETIEMLPWRRRNLSRDRYRLPLTWISTGSSKIVSMHLTLYLHLTSDVTDSLKG